MKIDPALIAASNALAAKPSRSRFRRAEGVSDSMEFRRIAGLPRRSHMFASTDDCEALSRLMATPSGSMVLLPEQATVFAELFAFRRLVGSICAGGGKTLMTLLMGRVLEVDRTVVLVPSGLVTKTREEYHVLREHWIVDHMPEVIGYELLGRVQAEGLLEQLAPKLIVADEAHRLKNPKAACTRRVKRYLKERAGQVIYVPLSGTLTGAALSDCAHQYEWALGEHSPVPRRHVDIAEWGSAIDVDVPAGSFRFTPGALEQLYSPEDAELAQRDELTAVRNAFERRVRETPGVVATEDTYGGSSILVQLSPLDVARPEVDEAMERLEELWCTPDDWPISDAAQKHAHGIEIGSGFFYAWDPRPPPEWVQAKRAWSATCRHVIDHGQRAIDSELQLINAIRYGRRSGEKWIGHVPTANGLVVGVGSIDETLALWEEVRDTFKPNSVPRWIDDAVIKYVAGWLEGEPAIVWCGHTALAERLSSELGLPYYGRKGLNARGEAIERANGKTPIIASIASSGTGRNLQAFHRSLVIPSKLGGISVEQLLARTHRKGQPADEVTYEILITCARAYRMYERALEKSRYIRDTTGQKQRILIADKLDRVAASMPRLTGPRWAFE
jgi:hypothetical protein